MTKLDVPTKGISRCYRVSWPLIPAVGPDRARSNDEKHRTSSICEEPDEQQTKCTHSKYTKSPKMNEE